MLAKFKTVMLALAVALCVLPASAEAENLRASADIPAGAISLEKRSDSTRENGQRLRKKKPRIRGEYTSARTNARRAAKAVRRAAPSANPTIYGACFYSDDFSANPGVYSFTPSEYELTPVLEDDAASGELGGYYYNGDYVSFTGSKPNITATTFDVNSWTLTDEVTGGTLVTQKTAIDPITGTIYAFAYGDDGITIELVTVNPGDFTKGRLLTVPDYDFGTLFFDNNGNLYVIDTEGNLYTVDKNSGDHTLKGNLDLEPVESWGAVSYNDYGGAAAVDPESGLCYFASDDWDCYLYEVNLETATATMLYMLENCEEFGALFIIPEGAAGGAPAKGSNLAVNFTEDALSGKVSFTAPTLDTEGNPGTGALNYILSVNTVAQSPVACQWGEAIDADVTVDAAGQYLFSVTFSNEVGESDAVTASKWIGEDAPHAVSNFKAVRSEDQTLLTWDAVTASVHGGYIVPAEVVYKITRLPENQVLTNDCSATSFIDELPDGNNAEFHTYEITAIWRNNVSDVTTSNRILAGAVYFNGFDSKDDMDRMTILTVLSNNVNKWERTTWFGGEAESTSDGEATSADTWMRTEPMALKGGRTYTFSLQSWAWTEGYDELLSIYFSDLDVKDPDLERNLYTASPVLDSYVVNWVHSDKEPYNPITCKFTPETDGNYFIAIRAHFKYLSQEREHTNLFVDDLTLTLDPIVPIPAAPEVTSSLEDLVVALTITAPTKDTLGADLESLTKVVVSRNNGEVTSTFDSVEPGQVITYTETLPGGGVYTYSVVAYNEHGHSDAATVTISAVPASKPNAPLRLSVAETANYGEVTLTWDAPQRDTNGNPVDASTLTYNIYTNGSAQPAVTGIVGTTHTYQAVAAGTQEFVSFYVTAENTAGEGAKSNVTAPAVYGTPDALPYSESFSNMKFQNLWNFDPTDAYEDAEWVIAASSSAPVANPQDNDGGMLAFYGEMLNDRASVSSGKIDLTEATTPRLSLWYFAENTSEGQNELTIYVNSGNGFVKVDQFSMRDELTNGWTKRTVNLAEYKGKVISLRLEGNYFRTDHFLLVDNIEVVDSEITEGKDLEAYLFHAPAEVYAGNEVVIDAYAKNNYFETVENVKITLYRDNIAISTSELGPIPAGRVLGSRWIINTDNTWKGSYKFHFVVDAGAEDKNKNNNTSDTKTVKISQHLLPTVGGLAASYSDDTNSAVKVEWTGPDFTSETAYTENFESFTPFVNDPESEWKFVDGDGAETYVIQGLVYPGYNEPHAFVVYEDLDMNETLKAKSGNKFIGAASAVQAKSNDWMISPALNGKAQTISFFARAAEVNPSYGAETLEVMTSSTGDDVRNFTVLKSFTLDSNQWTKYEVELPAGTAYFALHYTGNDAFLSFFDDITYAAAKHPAADFELIGYNIYRDGIRLNSEPVASLSHLDSKPTGAAHKYQLSVVYDRGESPLSAPVSIGESGLTDATVGVGVRAVAQGIEVTSTDAVAVNVFTADGRTVFAGTANGLLLIPAQPGFYVVKAAENSYKLIVE